MFKKFAILSVLFIGAAAIIAVAAFNHIRFEKAITDLVKQQLLIAAHIDAGSIQNSLRDIQRELEFLGRQYVSGRDNGLEPGIFEESYRQIDAYVASIELINDKGFVLDSWPRQEGGFGKDLNAAVEVKTMLKSPQIFFSDVFDFKGEQAVSYMVPVFKDGEFMAFFRAMIPLVKLNEWGGYVQQRKDEYSLILNSNGRILDYAQKQYVGKEITSVIKDKIPGHDASPIAGIMAAAVRGEEGAVTTQFLSGKNKIPLVKTVLAFSPVHTGSEPWVIVVAMDYNLIGWPIIRNALDNLFFVALVIVAVFILLKLRAKLFKDSVALTASNIIIKLLRSDSSDKIPGGGSKRPRKGV